jgi:hypothetical protein
MKPSELETALVVLLEDHKRLFKEACPQSTILWRNCIEVKQAHKALADVRRARRDAHLSKKAGL